MNIEKKYANEIKDSLEPKTTFDDLNISIPEKKVTKTFSAKKLVPYFSGVLACAIVCAVVIPILNDNNNPDPNPLTDITNKEDEEDKFYTEPIQYTDKPLNQRFSMPSGKFEVLPNSITSRIGEKMVNKISPIIREDKRDCVYSPASYALAITGMSSISSSFPNEEFGIQNADQDLLAMLNAWNYVSTENSSDESGYFKSAVMYQQVGDYYKFDEEKRESVGNNYISTLVSDKESWRVDAQTFFKNNLDINLKVPKVDIDNKGGVLGYGVLKMKDHAELNETPNEFNYESGVETINTYQFETKEEKTQNTYYYYEDETYEVFRIFLNWTGLVIVLPKEGISLDSIDVGTAYSKYSSKHKSVKAYGYIPYFHNVTIGASLATIDNPFEYQGSMCSKLLSDDVENDLIMKEVVQSTDFEFCKYGVSAESIAVVSSGATGVSVGGEKKCLNVDRPFYAISTYYDFPLFINKVTKPGK